jgi:hypothetical protein
MKWNFNDPTAGKDDMMPLTPEERKALYRGSALMLVILGIGCLIIYLMTC